MKYKCKNCGFIHEGEMPDGYYCPMCHTGMFDFKIIEQEEKTYNRKSIKEDNVCINRINEKCINCGACKKTCENIVGIIDEEKCINCGQCILTCPKAALTPKYNYQEVLNYINDSNYRVAVLTSPAVRVSIGDAFGFDKGEFLEGKMVSALKTIGFDYVFDTTFGADLISIEESRELLNRKNNNEGTLFSSCCPSWTRYAKLFHPELLGNISSCKSPIGAASTIIKEYYAKEEDIDLSHFILVALTPCTSKKYEILNSDTDYVITTSELALLLRELNINFKELEEDKFDSITGSSSGTIFGSSGGVTLSVLRSLYHEVTKKDLKDEEIYIKNKKKFIEYKIKAGKLIINTAAVSTMENLELILKDKEKYDFIEVMNCDGGCISGGGQILMPIVDKEDIKKARKKSLNKDDDHPHIKYAYKNEMIKDLYDEFLNNNEGIGLLHNKENL